MKRTLLLLLALAGGAVVVLVVGALLYLTFGDLSRFQPQIEAAVSKSLDREFRIGGELQIEALPHPSVLATDVTLANAEWASPEPMVAVGRVIVALDLWSLWSGPVIVNRLEIRDAKVLLEEGENERANYAFEARTERPPAPVPTESGEPAVRVILAHALVTATNIVVRRPAAEDFNLTIDSLEVTTNEDQSISAVLKGRAQDLAVGLDAKLDPASALQTGGPASYRLETALEDAKLAVAGHVDSLFASQPEGSAGGAVRQHVRFDGTVASLKLLGAVFDVRNLPEQELKLTGDLAFGADGIALEPLSIMLGGSDFSGSAKAELGDVPAIVVKGESSRLDLAPFFPAAPETGDAKAPAAATPPERSKTAADKSAKTPKGELVFSDAPLPFELLGKLELMLDVAVGELSLRDLRIEDLKLAVENAGGRARLKTSFKGPQGGSAESDIALDASSSTPALDVNLVLTDARLNLMSGELEDPDQIPPINIAVDVKSRGATAHALASRANGRIVFAQGQGLIANKAVGMVSGDIIAQLFSALNPASKEEEYTKLECTVVALNLTDGKGALDPILLETEKLQIVGGGDIELDSEKLDIEFNTKPREGVGISADMIVTPFVKLSGTLAKPGIGVNAKGAILQGGAAVLTGGASLLAGGLADRATAEADKCKAALATAHNPANP